MLPQGIALPLSDQKAPLPGTMDTDLAPAKRLPNPGTAVLSSCFTFVTFPADTPAMRATSALTSSRLEFVKVDEPTVPGVNRDR